MATKDTLPCWHYLLEITECPVNVRSDREIWNTYKPLTQESSTSGPQPGTGPRPIGNQAVQVAGESTKLHLCIRGIRLCVRNHLPAATTTRRHHWSAEPEKLWTTALRDSHSIKVDGQNSLSILTFLSLIFLLHRPSTVISQNISCLISFPLYSICLVAGNLWVPYDLLGVQERLVP